MRIANLTKDVSFVWFVNFANIVMTTKRGKNCEFRVDELFSSSAGGATRGTAGITTRTAFSSFHLYGSENLAERGTLALGAPHLAFSRDAGEFLKFFSTFLALEFIGRHTLL